MYKLIIIENAEALTPAGILNARNRAHSGRRTAGADSDARS